MPEEVVVSERDIGGLRWIKKSFILQFIESLHQFCMTCGRTSSLQHEDAILLTIAGCLRTSLLCI